MQRTSVEENWKYYHCFKKWANSGLFLFYFRYFLDTISIIEKSVDGVLGIRTRCRNVVGADETTELWRPLNISIVTSDAKNQFSGQDRDPSFDQMTSHELVTTLGCG